MHTVVEKKKMEKSYVKLKKLCMMKCILFQIKI